MHIVVVRTDGPHAYKCTAIPSCVTGMVPRPSHTHIARQVCPGREIIIGTDVQHGTPLLTCCLRGTELSITDRLHLFVTCELTDMHFLPTQSCILLVSATCTHQPLCNTNSVPESRMSAGVGVSDGAHSQQHHSKICVCLLPCSSLLKFQYISAETPLNQVAAGWRRGR